MPVSWLRRRFGRGLLAVVAALAMLSGCAAPTPPTAQPTLTVWTTEIEPDRFAITAAIAQRFTRQTGIPVRLVGVDEDKFYGLLVSAAADGNLPDVIGGIGLAAVRILAANNMLDTASAQAVVDTLDPRTFDPRALALTRDNGQQLAVPSDSWAQLIYYRKSLFERAGLAPPSTYAAILSAAQTLSQPGLIGFVGPTAADAAFTQQAFEHLALAHDCQLVDRLGRVTVDSPRCVQAFGFYQDLITNYSVRGDQTVDSVRDAYAGGRAAMAIWSTFLLDDLPPDVARDTAVVSAIQGGPFDTPAQYGEVTSWAIPVDANAAEARSFVRYVMSDGYLDWLGIAPEGKYPARRGPTPGSTAYLSLWAWLPTGTTRVALGDRYPLDALAAIGNGPVHFDRWGIEQNQGNLVGATVGDLPIAAAVHAVTVEGAPPAVAARQAQIQVRTLQASLL